MTPPGHPPANSGHPGNGPAPRVSVLLPTVGRIRFLPAALESILAQSLDDFEILAGDNASSDGSADFLRARAETDPRIRVYHVAERSMPLTWQRGLELARAPLFTVVSDDDLLEPDFLRDLAAPFADPETRIASCACTLIDSEGNPLPNLTAHRAKAFARDGTGPRSIRWESHAPSSRIMCSVMRTDWVRRYGFRPLAGLAADADLFWRAAIDGYRAHFLSAPLVRYRFHAGAASGTPVQQLRDARAALDDIEAAHPRLRDLATWQSLRSEHAAMLLHWLVRAGSPAEAVRTWQALRRRVPAAAAARLAAKLLLRIAGIYPNLVGRSRRDPALR